MQKLHLVGITPDLDGLILSTRKGAKSGSFIVSVDANVLEQLFEANRAPEPTAMRTNGVRAQPAGPRQSRPESSLGPREMQELLRGGWTLEEVAVEAGVDVDWVSRFAAPVLAEMRLVLDQAREEVFDKPRLGQSALPLAASVRRNVAERGVRFSDEDFDACWRAYQDDVDVWIIEFEYRSRGSVHQAAWVLDLQTGELTAHNRLAGQLGFVQSVRRKVSTAPPPKPKPKAAAVRAAAASPPEPLPSPSPPRRAAPKRRPARATRAAPATPVVAEKPAAVEKPAVVKRAATPKKAAAAKRAAPKKAAAKRAAPKKATPKKAAAAKRPRARKTGTRSPSTAAGRGRTSTPPEPPPTPPTDPWREELRRREAEQGASAYPQLPPATRESRLLRPAPLPEPAAEREPELLPVAVVGPTVRTLVRRPSRPEPPPPPPPRPRTDHRPEPPPEPATGPVPVVDADSWPDLEWSLGRETKGPLPPPGPLPVPDGVRERVAAPLGLVEDDEGEEELGADTWFPPSRVKPAPSTRPAAGQPVFKGAESAGGSKRPRRREPLRGR